MALKMCRIIYTVLIYSQSEWRTTDTLQMILHTARNRNGRVDWSAPSYDPVFDPV